MERAGHDPEAIGPDPERLARIGAFVELHVEQGRALDLSGDPVGVASAIWPHGRWRFDFHGEANHAGTTRLEDRRDPMLTYADTVLAARKEARLAGALATFGKVAVEPNGVNAIPSLVRGWLDSRAADEDDPRRRRRRDRAGGRRARPRATAWTSASPASPSRPSWSSTTPCATGSPRHARAARPVLPTGAGHDAGSCPRRVPTAMLFVRNPTGVSHSPAEYAERGRLRRRCDRPRRRTGGAGVPLTAASRPYWAGARLARHGHVEPGVVIVDVADGRITAVRTGRRRPAARRRPRCAG